MRGASGVEGKGRHERMGEKDNKKQKQERRYGAPTALLQLAPAFAKGDDGVLPDGTVVEAGSRPSRQAEALVLTPFSLCLPFISLVVFSCLLTLPRGRLHGGTSVTVWHRTLMLEFEK